jgi:hypothetical protein
MQKPTLTDDTDKGIWIMIGAIRSGKFLRCTMSAMLALACGLNCRPLVCADVYNEVRNVRQKASEQYKTGFNQLAQRLKADARFKEFQERLSRLEAVAALILKDLAIHHADYVRRNMAIIGDGADENASKSMGALKIFAENQAGFSTGVPLPEIAEADQNFLEEYYAVNLAALKKHVAAKAQEYAKGKDAPEIECLALVLPLLHCSDDLWSQNELDQLPTWLRRAEPRNVLMEFALKARRSRTAFMLSRTLDVPATDSSKSKLDAPPGPVELEQYVNFLEKGADLMLRNKDWEKGLYYLDTASAAAHAAHLRERRTELRFRVAEVLNESGGPQKALDELEQLMRSESSDSDYGKAAMLRLKCLYALPDGNRQILAEAPAYMASPRCEKYLPQILYIAWSSSRNANKYDEAEVWRREFLNKYPAHPLGADIYFATAMSSLAAADYNGALRVFHFIEYRFPESKLMPRIKDIEQRLPIKPAVPANSQPEISK